MKSYLCYKSSAKSLISCWLKPRTAEPFKSIKSSRRSRRFSVFPAQIPFQLDAPLVFKSQMKRGFSSTHTTASTLVSLRLGFALPATRR
ncbi:hypothetical protein KFK09_014699 [Dendrobium nobile]|uniref:Uncharacterized protein n=1 Tax=Dendrobium nobile TaxID=94219 RepID=A0A8T3B3V8_DENNO|nr:hypothetical protein KFK09_014699 [Dendrobium nobile]